MKNFLGVICLALMIGGSGTVLASGGGVQLQKAHVDLSDTASLQRGAKLFVNYCLSCHSAHFMRYNRVGRDLGISEELLQEHLMFASDKSGEVMNVAMSVEDGERWFGVAPPDLSVIARSRGANWLYTYFLSFYEDSNPSRPFGVNNLVFKDVGMPHVLWKLQGRQVPVYAEDEHGKKHIESLKLVEPGILNADEYRRAMRDLTGFLVYVGEPAKLVRYGIGFWVLLFLAGFFLLTRLLYREYWKDLH